MKNIRPLIIMVVFMLIMGSCQNRQEHYIQKYHAISNNIDGLIHEPGNWKPDLQPGQKGTSLGNHRVIIKADSGHRVVWAHIPWRRNDLNPIEKALILIDAKTGKEVRNKVLVNLNNEYCDIVFQPAKKTETYYIYYMPYQTTGGYYPKVRYIPPEISAEKNWLESLETLTKEFLKQLPQARVLSIQSIDSFHSFFPMEVIATSSEVKALLDTMPKAYYLFPEYREYPIRMRQFLPKHWVDRGLMNTFYGETRRGEYYTFQVGIYAANQDMENLALIFSDLKTQKGELIEKTAFNTFNTEGVDEFGRKFMKSVSIKQRTILPIWIGVHISKNTKAGLYKGSLTIKSKQNKAQTLQLKFRVTDEIIDDCGDSQPANMSRLRWLNSKIGTDPDFIVNPYVPVSVNEKTLRILGREIVLNNNGLPKNIRSYFTQEMTGLGNHPQEILAYPVKLDVKSKNSLEKWISQPFEIKKTSKGQASWKVENLSENFNLQVEGVIEYEGMLNYKLILTAKKDVAVEDIVLSIPMKPDAAIYILGLGFKGQKRPPAINWKWDVTNHHEGIWLGNVNKGLQYVLRDENYERPLNTNFYQAQPLKMPPSWYNSGKGGIRIETRSETIIAYNYSGPRKLAQNDTLYFNVRFLVTPFKTIDTHTHFNTRFVHKYVPVDSVRKWGGTVVNIHHANEINPYINYPFFSLKEQSAYIQEAHRKDIKVKLYYTIRELTYKCHELFALRSLGDEILNDGDGDGHPWLQEHLQDRYHKGWHAWRVNDAAILNKGNSRWTNYYIEGLNWLAKNQQIDGLYLDDIAFSRETVKRMISVLHQHRENVVIDLHSANQFNPRDGFINSAFLYLEHIPFVSRLWFGEYFEYDNDEDYWLTEVSGIPFGLMGEMLEKGGHPYRGMLYGMTTRLYGKFDPRPIWKLFDEFGIANSRMIGYWVEPNPVRTNHERIFATTYVNKQSALVALASWASEDLNINLNIDWNKLGILNSETAIIVVPEIRGLQEYKKLNVDDPIHIAKEQGLFIKLMAE